MCFPLPHFRKKCSDWWLGWLQVTEFGIEWTALHPPQLRISFGWAPEAPKLGIRWIASAQIFIWQGCQKKAYFRLDQTLLYLAVQENVNLTGKLDWPYQRRCICICQRISFGGAHITLVLDWGLSFNCKIIVKYACQCVDCCPNHIRFRLRPFFQMKFCWDSALCSPPLQLGV